MTNIGSPDGTYASVYAIQQIAESSDGSEPLVVDIPGGFASIIILAYSFSTDGSCTVTKVSGTTTNVPYAFSGQVMYAAIPRTNVYTVVAPILIDDQLSIIFDLVGDGGIVVYGCQAPIINYDALLAQCVAINGASPSGSVNVSLFNGIDGNNRQWVLPTIPEGGAGNHPLIEMSSQSWAFTTTSELLAAPGEGYRYRLFACQMTVYSDLSTGNNIYVQELVHYAQYCTISTGAYGTAFMSFGTQGIPLPNNAGIGVGYSGGSSGTIGVLTYVVEEI